jgi:hypothetical protein
MRGLTPPEYAVMQLMVGPLTRREATEDEMAIVVRLSELGRVSIEYDIYPYPHYVARATREGREAMRLHEAAVGVGS